VSKAAATDRERTQSKCAAVAGCEPLVPVCIVLCLCGSCAQQRCVARITHQMSAFLPSYLPVALMISGAM
jgi:hypothetical protein